MIIRKSVAKDLKGISKKDVRRILSSINALADEPRVIVNLSGVQFMDSAGLGALIGGIRRIRESEGRVTIFSDREAITKLLHTTGFDRIVPVKDVLAEAVAALDEDPDA